MPFAQPQQPSDSVSINHATFNKLRVVRGYRNFTELYPAEEYIFSRYARQFSGDVLDIAIGAGRTTRALLPRARSYVGLDFSPSMIEAARESFPQAELHCADMRFVPAMFKERRFDAILISFNGIDYISWEDRNALLHALRLLLRPAGILVFSTHDLRMAQQERRFKLREDLRPRLRMLRSQPGAFLVRLLKLPVWALLAWASHWRNRRNERFFPGYAYLNDSGESFGLLTVYSAPRRSVEGTRRVGLPHSRASAPAARLDARSVQLFRQFASSRRRARSRAPLSLAELLQERAATARFDAGALDR